MSRTAQEKRDDAAAHNAAIDFGRDMMTIGRCGTCGQPLVVYLKSRLENCCNYYCMGEDGHTGSLKSPDKKDTLLFPLKDILAEVRQHYDEKAFDEFLAKD